MAISRASALGHLHICPAGEDRYLPGNHTLLSLISPHHQEKTLHPPCHKTLAADRYVGGAGQCFEEINWGSVFDTPLSELQ